MSNNTRRLVLLAALLSCGAVFADPTSDKLTRIESETLLLKARERQLDVQASILTKQNEIAARKSAISQLGQSPVAGDPLVHGVEGLGRTMFATLQLSDGTLVEAQTGEVLANGMRVLSIAPGKVIVQKGKKRVRLALHTPRQAALTSNLPSPGPILPMPPQTPKGVAR